MRTRKLHFLVFSWITLALTSGVNGQDSSTDASKDDLNQILQGHSQHGEAFNKGPRQKAYLIGGTGNISFPITTNHDEVQAHVNQGLGQLHGFWDLEAERTFRQAMALDSNCAMAYWGAALATKGDKKRSQGFIAKAMELKDKVTEREQMYIEAVNKFVSDKPDDSKKRAAQYLKDLESIVLKFPDDLEAKALVAHRIWENGRAGIPVASYIATNALLTQIFEQEPLHPSHHYAIHLWDYRDPKMALDSAARCGISAPSIAHMWHMPGHIYSRLKRYEDAVFQQEASTRVDHAYMMRDSVMPDEISNFAHNNEWLIRNLVFVGRASDAMELAKNMVSLPRHPEYNVLEKNRGSHSYGRRRLLQVLREFQLHDQAIALCQSPYLNIPDNTSEQLKTLRLLGCAAAISERPLLAKQTIEEIEEIQKDQQQELDTLQARAKLLERMKEPGDDLPPIPEQAQMEPEAAKKELETVNKDLGSAKRITKACDKALLAIKGYTSAANLEFTEAAKQLKEASGEDLSWVGELKILGGDVEGGIKDLRSQIKRRKQETIPQARLVWALSQLPTEAPERNDLKKEFLALRDMSSSIDRNVQLFRRLDTVAQSLGFKKAWLKAPALAADTGFRPPLDTLGPFRWEPSQAASWELPDGDNNLVASSEFQGKPHVVIFYLGHGCLHCAEQLQAFAPHLEEFRKSGIELVAISSDPQTELSNDLENFNGEMPFEWHLADGKHEVFKKFRAFDDFENQPLHATLLIDGRGQVRWQDISYQPFMDHEFLLNEAQRLLSQDTQADEIQISGR